MNDDDWPDEDMDSEEPLPGEDAQQHFDRINAQRPLKPNKASLKHGTIRNQLIERIMAKTGMSRADAERALKDEGGL